MACIDRCCAAAAAATAKGDVGRLCEVEVGEGLSRPVLLVIRNLGLNMAVTVGVIRRYPLPADEERSRGFAMMKALELFWRLRTDHESKCLGELWTPVDVTTALWYPYIPRYLGRYLSIEQVLCVYPKSGTYFVKS